MIDRENSKPCWIKYVPPSKLMGGDVELINIREDNVVEVRLKGACNGCPMATLTLKGGH